jgi:inositol phosphorylceramide mannosyltransferase catalytic subunit
MAYVNHGMKALFLHNVKCGGCYIRKKLMDHYKFEQIGIEPHEKFIEFFDDEKYVDFTVDCDFHSIRKMGKYRYFYSHQNGMKEILENYFTFTFVRNPYERFFSAYTYLKTILERNEKGNIRNTPENIAYFTDINTFIKNISNVNNISYFHTFITQYDQFINHDGSINISYIGKYENLETEFINVLNILGLNLKHQDSIYLNKTVNRISYFKNILDEFTEDTFNFINEYFANDFIAFNYKRYESFKEFQDHYNNKSNPTKLTVQLFVNKYYKEIPLRIPPKQQPLNNQIIPKRIIQTFKTNKIHPHIYDNIMSILYKNPEYEYMFITDEVGIDLIKEHFDERTLQAFLKLKVGAAKGDFLRYIALYVYGGVYLDLDASIEIDLNTFIPNDKEFVLFYTPEYVIFTQWVIMITKQHSFISDVISEMVNRIHDGENNIYLATGPDLFTEVMYKILTGNKIYHLQKKTSKIERFNIFVNIKASKTFSKGEIYDTYSVIHSKQILFRLRNYNEKMIYYDNHHYKEMFDIFKEPPKVYKNVPFLAIYEPSDLIANSDELFVASILKHLTYIENNDSTQKKLIKKFEGISNELLSTLERYSNNFIMRKEIHDLKHALHLLDLEKQETESYNSAIKNIKQLLAFKVKTEPNESECGGCKFKCFNKLAYFSHINTCS